MKLLDLSNEVKVINCGAKERCIEDKNSIGDAEARILSRCVDKIDDLNLKNCNITEEGVSALAEQINKRETLVY